MSIRWSLSSSWLVPPSSTSIESKSVATPTHVWAFRGAPSGYIEIPLDEPLLQFGGSGAESWTCKVSTVYFVVYHLQNLSCSCFGLTPFFSAVFTAKVSGAPCGLVTIEIVPSSDDYASPREVSKTIGQKSHFSFEQVCNTRTGVFHESHMIKWYDEL